MYSGVWNIHKKDSVTTMVDSRSVPYHATFSHSMPVQVNTEGLKFISETWNALKQLGGEKKPQKHKNLKHWKYLLLAMGTVDCSVPPRLLPTVIPIGTHAPHTKRPQVPTHCITNRNACTSPQEACRRWFRAARVSVPPKCKTSKYPSAARTVETLYSGFSTTKVTSTCESHKLHHTYLTRNSVDFYSM